MPNYSTDYPKRSVLLSFKFLGTALAGSLTMALVSVFGSVPVQIGMLGTWVSILTGLFVSYVEQEDKRERRRAELLEKLQLPVALAPDYELFSQYTVIARSLADLAGQGDPVLREFAIIRLSSLSEEVRLMAAGKIVFSTTETWRIVYEQILQSTSVKFYQSVAWVKTKEYWQDKPGKQSMATNFQVLNRGVEIERICILRGDLWSVGEPLPYPDIRLWIEEQHKRGIKIFVVRESEIGSEPNLICDFGIYGDRATGVQELDEQSHTVRFTLFFDQQNIRLARARWARLKLYATPYVDLLNSAPRQKTI